MVIAVEDIVDIESLEAWLNERPEELRRQCAVWISARSAARAIPKDWYGQHFDKRARERGLNGVWVSRCLLIAIAAMPRPQENFQDPKYVALAESYKNNAFFVDSSAPSAVGVAASSDVESQMAYLILAVTPQPELMDEVYAKHFFSAGSHGASSFERAHGIKEIFALPRVDCQLWLEFEGAGGIDIARLQFASLWPDENPLAPEWEDLKAKLIADATSDDPYSADWSFWIDWYEGLLEGRAQNIYMLLEIVTTDKID